VVNFRFQSIYLRCPFENGLACSRSSLDAVANRSKSALLSGVKTGFLIIIKNFHVFFTRKSARNMLTEN